MDNYLTQPDKWTTTEYIHGIILWVAWFIGTAMISRVAKNFQDYFVNVMTQKIGTAIYQNTISHIFSLPYAVFEDQQSWQLLQKLIRAKESIQTYIASLINVVFVALVGVIFVLLYSFSVDRKVGLTYLILMPIVGLTTMWLSKKIKAAQTSISLQSNSLSGSITESIRNVSLIKMLGLVPQEIKRIDGANNKILDLELDKVKKIRTMEFLQGTLINSMRVSLIGLLGYLVYTKSISVGELMSLYFYSFFLFGQLSQFGTVVKSYQEARANHDILEEMLAQESEPINTDGIIIDHINRLSAKDVSFGYQADAIIIDHITFDVKKWETIAFVGPSGSGKSTILKLICWLYTPQSWILSINNHKLQDLNRTLYQQKIGIVAQDAQLFSGTIRDNLLFVQPNATNKDCREVLEHAQLSEFVKSLWQQLDTMIGEWWIKLSGWQKQRLAIARALLRDPQILIFDEATSSLDSLIEKEIADTINDISSKDNDMMTILVAHRLSTVMKANRIYVLEHGKVIESGTHHELLANKWLYYALRREQSGE